VVDIGAELFAMPAAVVRAGMLQTDGQHGREAVELADCFCKQSRLRLERLFDALWDNTDAPDARLARDVLSDRYSWLEEGIIDPAPTGPWIAQADAGPSSARTSLAVSSTANKPDGWTQCLGRPGLVRRFRVTRWRGRR
jgi:hypothetical protein